MIHSKQYPYPAGLRMLSRDRYYRAHYDKVPLAPPHHDPRRRPRDDPRGHRRRRPLRLAQGLRRGTEHGQRGPTGKGGVWLMNAPYLLFYPDADGDDKPDGDPVVHLSGFGFEDSHSAANGLVWGPDGWIYGGQGSTVSCRVVRPGSIRRGIRAFISRAAWSGDTTPDAGFRDLRRGSGNTFGLEFDSVGRLYSGHNGGGTRGWHYVQGGFYLMQGVDPGKFGPPRNPYAFGDLPMMATKDPVVRFTHFGAFADARPCPRPCAACSLRSIRSTTRSSPRNGWLAARPSRRSIMARW